MTVRTVSRLVLSILLGAASMATADTTFLPGAAEITGLAGARFSSTLELTNPGSTPATTTIGLLPMVGTAPPAPVTRVLAAGESLRVTEVLKSLFGITDGGAGTITIASDAALLASLSTRNVAAPEGPYGLGLLAVPEAELLGAGETGHSIWVSQSKDPAAGYRTNLSVTLVDAGTVVVVRVLDAGGNAVGETTITAAAPGVWQQPVTSLIGAVDLPVARAEFQVRSGRATAYAVVNDNVTSDAIALQAERAPAGAADRLVSGAAYSPGLLGAFWVTDLRLCNPGATPLDATIQSVGASRAASVVIPVPAGGVVEAARVLALLGFPEGTACALRVKAAGPLLVAARTNNIDPTGVRKGTFSAQQFVTTWPAGLLGAGEAGFFNGIDQTLTVPGSRTNLALVGGPDGAAGSLVLRDAAGVERGRTAFTRGAGEWGQLGVADWFAASLGTSSSRGALGLASVPENARIDVQVDRGELDAYVSRIDNGSGDAITSPVGRPGGGSCAKVAITAFSAPIPVKPGVATTLSWTLVLDPPTAGLTSQTLAFDGEPPIELDKDARSYVKTFASAGARTATLTVRRGSCEKSRSLAIVVCGDLAIEPATLPGGSLGTAYSATLTAPSGAAPLVFSVLSGALPPGLALSQAGELSGKPTAAGTFAFSVGVTDANGCTGTKSFTVVIACPQIGVSPSTLPSGTVGAAYGPVALTASGGGSGNWEASGLPPGLTLTSTGTLAGVPTTAGSYAVNVRFRSAAGCGATATYTLIVCGNLTVSPSSLAGATAGVALAPTTFAVTGATGAATWAVTTGALPAGVALDASTGVLSGTPTVVGPFPFTVTATDSLGCRGTVAVSLAVACPTIAIAPAALVNGTAGVAYGPVALSQTGGIGAVTYAVTTGALPAGVTLSAAGVLSGTPTVVGTFSFTVTATDGNGCTGTHAYSLTIACPSIAIAPAALANGTAGVTYGPATLTQTGGLGTVTYAVTVGALPAGVTLSAAGVLSGTPTVVGPFSFTVTATDANGCQGTRAYSLTIACPAIAVSPAVIPDGTAGAAYAGATFAQTGGVGAVTFSLFAGPLPNGMSLSAAGVLSGTPTQAGTFPITVRATDANGCTGDRAVTLTVHCPTITVSPASIASGTAGVVYPGAAFTQTGGVGAVTFSLSSGTLPAGITLSPAGSLAGTPTQTGAFPITVRATDANGCTGDRAVTLTILCPTIVATAGAPVSGIEGSALGPVAFTQTGGVGAVVWSSTGTLPGGVTFSAAGVLTGTPAAGSAGSYTATFTATDQNLCTGSIRITFRVCPVVTVGPTPIAAFLEGQSYTETVVAAGGVAPYTYAVTAGTLPTGVTFAATGALSGIPTVLQAYDFTVTATDANGCTGSRQYTGRVCPVITIPTNLPNGVVGAAYGQTLAAGGSPSTPYAYSVTGGALPDGLTLASTGTLSGSPTTAGSFTFTVTATDTIGCTGSRTYTVRICPVVALAPPALGTGFLSTPYSQNVAASGGVAPYAYAVTAGSLPPGLALNGSTGDVAGSPTASGDYPFTVTATDANGCAGSRAYVIKVCTVLTLSPGSLSGPTVGTAYNQSVAASGGTAPYGYAVTAGALPTGLTLNTTTGAITGTPTVAGPYGFTITATDVNGCSGSHAYAVTAACPPITLSPTSLPAATATLAYSQTMTASGGAAAYSFAVTAGALPAGLTLTAGGVLSGTPTVHGSFGFSITATDANGCTGAQAYTFTVNCPTITVSPVSLPAGSVGAAWNQTVSAAGGTAPYTFAVTAGALPTGLTLNTSTGAITGTPSAAGTFVFTVTATDGIGCSGSRAYSVTTTCPLVTVSPGTLPAGIIGSAYGQTVSAAGGSPAYTYTVTSGSLPTGLSLDPVSGGITGTPTAAGPFSFTITATDVYGCAGATAYSVRICPVITVTPGTLPGGVVGSPYAQTVAGSGGAAPYTFAVTAGTLPTSLTLNPSTGDVAGTPTAAGLFGFTITATDANGCTGSTAYSVRICPVVTVNPATLPSGVVGSPYAGGPVTASGGAPAYNFSVTTGALPSGVTLNGDGTFSGTPTAAGLFGFTVTATDANGCTGSRAYSVRICPVITVTPGTLPGGVVGSPYSQTVAGSGGAAPYLFAVTAGTLPTSLTLNPSTGAVTGTPTAAGLFSFTITATDANGCTGSTAYSVRICPVVTVNPATLPNGTVGTPYAGGPVTASGGSPAYGFAVTSGALPNGVTLNGDGTFSGTPTAPGLFSFTVTATDANGCTGSRAYSVRICPVIAVTPGSLPAGKVGSSYSQTVAGSGGAAPYTFAVTSGTLPTSLALNASTGAITGTPTAAGVFNFTITATDTNGCTGSIAYGVRICPVLSITPASPATPVYQTAYSQTLTGSGGAGPYTFALASGTLPPGLSIVGTALSGTPTNTGTFSFSLTVTDANGCSDTQAFSLTTRPDAQPNSYNNGVGNTQYVAAAACPTGTTPNVCSAVSVLANDAGPGTLAAGPAVIPAANGSVAMSANGFFTYTPNVGFAGPADTFTYTLTDGNGVTSTALVTVNLSGRVWYVNNTFVGASDGRSNTPFTTVTGVNGAATQNGDVVFVHTGSGGTAGNLTLKPSQALWGNGVAFTLGGLTIAAGTRPTLTGTITLANDVVVRGSTFSPSGAIPALTGSALTGTITIDQNVISASNAGTAVSLSTGTANVSFTSTPLSQSGVGTGLAVNGKTGGTVSFDAASTIGVTGAGATGINLTSNTGATFSFAGALTLTTTTGNAFTATGGGTVTATAASNVVTTTTGTGVRVVNTTIGAGGLVFRSISSNGAPNGIFLDNTGSSGGLTVTGNSAGFCGGQVTPAQTPNAADCTGGVIQNVAGADGATSGIGVFLRNTSNVSLTRMELNGAQNFAIRGFSVTGFSMSDSYVHGTNGNSASENEGSVSFGAGTGEPGGPLNGLTGAASFTRCTIQGGFEDNLRVMNQSGTLNRLTVTNTTIGPNDATNGNDGILLEPQGTAVINATIQNSAFTSARGDLFQFSHGGTATSDLVFTGNTLSNNHPAIATGGGGVTIGGGDQGGGLTFNLSNNSFRDAVGHAVLIFKSTGGGLFSGTFANNTIGVNGAANSGSREGSGLKVQNAGQGEVRIAITGNTIREYNNQGIELIAGGGAVPQSGAMNLTVTGNTVTKPGNYIAGMVNNGLYLDAGTVVGDTYQICATIGGAGALKNSMNNSSANGGYEINLWQRMLTTVKLPGYSGANNDNATVGTFVVGNNGPPNPSILVRNSLLTYPAAGGFVGGAACALP